MTICAETIGPQKLPVRRALKSIHSKIDKDQYGAELRLVPVLTFKIDENMTAPLKKVVMKHSNIVSNEKQYETDNINKICSSVSSDSDLTLRKIITGLKAEGGERFAITITRN